MKNTKFLFIITIFIEIGLLSCTENKNDEFSKTVRDWTGKEIHFPENLACYFMNMDTTCVNLYNDNFKILFYVDSLGCTSCRLKQLYVWKRIISESDSVFEKSPVFLFFFNPKRAEENDLKSALKNSRFKYNVFIDSEDKIGKSNKFPLTQEFQCFLLDRNNKVLLIGNPASNPKIWELYKQTISGKAQEEKQPLTTVSVSQPEAVLTGLQKSKTSTTVFKLTNTGSNPLIINYIKSSCGCTAPVYDKKPVEPGKEAEVKVEIAPDKVGVFHKTIQVYCNTKKGVVLLAVKGMVEQ